jgi:hypothetical protein
MLLPLALLSQIKKNIITDGGRIEITISRIFNPADDVMVNARRFMVRLPEEDNS